MKNYTPIIGLEIHVELRTHSKMFCGCPGDHFGKAPNTQTCPVCLGLPGALPVPNKKAVEWALMLGLALNCKVNKESKFDRKHYFYPDLPKGYQISQYEEPLASHGWLKFSNSPPRRQAGNLQFPNNKVGITRVHLEEDTGKLQHITLDGEKVSLVDFNRSGVPLVEIVSDPGIRSAGQAKEYAQKIQQIVRYLEISDSDMEKGSMRLEANISLQNQKAKGKNQKLPDYKVEVKNINSFRFLEKAINYEIERQAKLLSQGKKISQETRGWSEKDQKTVSQRSKETAADYRYFPEPDIPPMEFSESFIKDLKKRLPDLPDKLVKEFIEKYSVREEYAKILASDKNTAKLGQKVLEIAVKEGVKTDDVAGIIINQKVNLVKANIAKIVSDIKKTQSGKISDSGTLEKMVEDAIKLNPKAVEDYKKGKTQSISVLIGAAMRLSSDKADAKSVKEILEKRLQ